MDLTELVLLEAPGFRAIDGTREQEDRPDGHCLGEEWMADGG